MPGRFALLFAIAILPFGCNKPDDSGNNKKPAPSELKDQIAFGGERFDIGAVELRGLGQPHLGEGNESYCYKLTLRDVSGTFETSLDIFSGSETLAPSNSLVWGEDMGAGSFSGSFTQGGNTTAFTGGTLLITVTGEVYELALETTTSQEGALEAQYSGEVDYYPFVAPAANEVVHDGDKYDVNRVLVYDFGQPSPGAGNANYNFDFVLTDKTRSFELYIETTIATPTPESGTLTWSTGRQAGTFACYFNPDTSAKTVFETVSGRMEITISDDVYQLTVDCTTKQGKSISACYKGNVNMVDTTPDFDNIPTTNSMVYGSNSYQVHDGFVTSYGQAYLRDYGIASHVYDISLYAPNHSTLVVFETLHASSEFTSGQFKLSSSREPGTFYLEGIVIGLADIQRSGNDYELKFNALDRQGVEINIYYKGELKPIGF
jgi:hypothetical protein